MAIPKKVSERIKKNLPKFQKVLEIAKIRDVNESDTVSIVTDMLQEIFGYDKYIEVTSELAIRGTYCDLAIKLDNKYPYLIEVKAIGIDLKEKHKKQAIDYGANKGIKWIILTNGLIWNVYRIRFEQPINYDLVFTLDILSLNHKSEKDILLVYMLCKGALSKNVKEEYYEKVQNVNKYILGNLLLSDNVVTVIRRELRKFAEGVKIDMDEIVEIIKNDVLKRDIVEGEEADDARRRLRRHFKLSEKPKQPKQTPTPDKEELSLSDQLLKNADSE